MENEAVKNRRLQEEMTNFLDGGYYKPLMRMHKEMFDEYVRLCFTRDEAIRLVIGMMDGKD